jgi:endonuclease YncB( thermonuclease family)
VDRTSFEEGEDLAAYLIRHGWALARPGAPFEYHALERIAREQSAGVWGFSVDAIRPGRR